MKFSNRVPWPTHPNPLTQKIEALGKENILDLTLSNPTQCQFEYLKSDILQSFLNPQNLHYEPLPHGLKKAREAVSAYYKEKNIDIHPDEIFLTASTSEAYSFLFRLLLEPGDTILAPQPSYPLFEYLTALHDIQMDHYPVIYQNSWRFNLDPKKTGASAILIVNPNNPTGNFVQASEADHFISFSKSQSVPIISDEVFLDFSWNAGTSKPISFASRSETLCFTLGGISKMLGLPQMKLSWIVVTGPEKIKKEALERLETIADTYLSVSTPAQNALPEWFGLAHDIQKEISQRLKQNYEKLKNETGRQDFAKLLDVQGGWYAILELPKNQNDEERAMQLLEKEHVLTHPGYLFDFKSGDYLVLSLLPPPDIFSKGVGRIMQNFSKHL